MTDAIDARVAGVAAAIALEIPRAWEQRAVSWTRRAWHYCLQRRQPCTAN